MRSIDRTLICIICVLDGALEYCVHKHMVKRSYMPVFITKSKNSKNVVDVVEYIQHITSCKMGYPVVQNVQMLSGYNIRTKPNTFQKEFLLQGERGVYHMLYFAKKTQHVIYCRVKSEMNRAAKRLFVHREAQEHGAPHESPHTHWAIICPVCIEIVLSWNQPRIP